jgi:class 3 adenylate cyclase
MNRVHKEEMAEDAIRSVKCALAISDRLEELNQNWKSRGLPVIQMRLGIYTGPRRRMESRRQRPLGVRCHCDSVNIASRLESCEKDRQESNCRILIGHETFVHLHEQFLVESWGPLPLKGKHKWLMSIEW